MTEPKEQAVPDHDAQCCCQRCLKAVPVVGVEEGSLADARPHRATEQPVVGDGRDIRGETVMGMRVAAYRHPQDAPGDIEPEKWDAFFHGSPPNTYAEHWSTPGAHRTDVERLFAEADVRALQQDLQAQLKAAYEALEWAEERFLDHQDATAFMHMRTARQPNTERKGGE